jgi:SAM-dependent methyltransferase
MTTRDQNDDRTALDLLLRGFAVSRMLRLVAHIGLADKIPRRGAVDVGELATSCNVKPAQLLRVLRALAAFGVFRVDTNGGITHSRRSVLLRTDEPQSMHYGAKFWTAPGSWQAWGALEAALADGVPHEVAWHMGRFQYLREHPQEARDFDAFMANFPDRRHAAVAESYDFSGAALITDVGGGNGEALRQILARFPQVQGMVYDRADVVNAIAPDARAGGRLSVQGGDFFESVPSGADTYLLVRVLHDWPDDDSVRILRNCRAAMSDKARLLVVDQILEPDPSVGHPIDYLVDVQMMAMFGAARERTAAEFTALLSSAGFTVTGVMATPSSVSIVEALPA